MVGLEEPEAAPFVEGPGEAREPVGVGGGDEAKEKEGEAAKLGPAGAGEAALALGRGGGGQQSVRGAESCVGVAL